MKLMLGWPLRGQPRVLKGQKTLDFFVETWSPKKPICALFTVVNFDYRQSFDDCHTLVSWEDHFTAELLPKFQLHPMWDTLVLTDWSWRSLFTFFQFQMAIPTNSNNLLGVIQLGKCQSSSNLSFATCLNH